MNQVVDPNNFKVPYAIGVGNTLYHIKDGRPKCQEIACPICGGPVSFVMETERAAAHFRHHSRTDCDQQFHLLRGTIHNDVRDATARLLNSAQYCTDDICKGQAGITLPRGKVEVEAEVTLGGKTYRPDLTVSPAEGQEGPTLELEVIWSHKPTPERLKAAAEAGRAVAVLNASRIENDYLVKRYTNQAFDIPEAIKQYILDERYSVLTDRDLKRAINGKLYREYMKARVAVEHQEYQRGPSQQLVQKRRIAAPAQSNEPVPAVFEQEALTGDADSMANTVLERLRKCTTGQELTDTMARHRDVIASIQEAEPVRVIHINNLVEQMRQQQIWGQKL